MKTTNKPDYKAMKEAQRDMNPDELETELIRIGRHVAKNLYLKSYKGIGLEELESEAFLVITQKAEYLKSMIKNGDGAQATRYLTTIVSREHMNLLTAINIENRTTVSLSSFESFDEAQITELNNENVTFMSPWIIKDGLNKKRKYVIDFLRTVATEKQLEALDYFVTKGDDDPLSPVFTNRLHKLQLKACSYSSINSSEK